MKRVIFSLLATITGLIALLSFKTGSHTTIGASLPSASLGTSSTSAAAAASPTSSAASGPPNTGGSSTAPSSTASTPAVSTKTYSGTAVQTRYGTVQVAVTVSGSKITNVSFLQLTSHDGRSADINSQAAPLLLQETLSAQSSKIDTISGATYTSEGYLQSLQSALDQAGLK